MPLSGAFIKGDLIAVTRGPCILCSLISLKKGQLISEHIKGPLVAAIRSPLMKVLNRSVK